MTVYAPGTEETDLKKLNMSLQQNAGANTTNATNIATNTTNIATNTTAISTINSTLSTLAGSKISNVLSADVALNNTGNYFDGPSIAQGSTGTWFVSGTVTLVDTAGAAAFIAKLWDGTTVIASARNTSTGASNPTTIALSGYMTSPAGNLRISCRDSGSTSGAIAFNNSGNSKDSSIWAYRIA